MMKQNKNKCFEITQKVIDTIYKAPSFMKIMGNFSDYVNDNFYGTNVEECYKIYKEYVTSNEHIIKK
jgi:hypothetical protein